MTDTQKVGNLLSAGTTKKHDIPLGYLDFTYINECKDIKMLEKIYRILKSGDEGCYPQLENCCEDKIKSINPNSRVLRKENPLKTKSGMEKEEREELDNDLKSWSNNMKFMEDHLQAPASIATDDTDEELPPIRSGNITLTADGAKSSKETPNPNKRVTPRDYREWDKIDVDRELEKVDEADQTSKERTFIANKEMKNASIPVTVDAKGLTEGEKLMKANREKDKGNEAFRANDFKEAITYYSRSISLQPTAASYNNRALAYLKSTEWQKAIVDTNTVLKMEPDNVKALLRRGTAHKGLKQYDKAMQDLHAVIKKEPNNKKAQELLDEIDKINKKEKEERKTKGRRMVIEDVEEIDEEEVQTEPLKDNEDNSDEGSKPVNTDKRSDSPKRQARRMQIEEIESDEDEEETKRDSIKVVNGDASVGELKAQQKEVVVNGHPKVASMTAHESKNKEAQDTEVIEGVNEESSLNSSADQSVDTTKGMETEQKGVDTNTGTDLSNVENSDTESDEEGSETNEVNYEKMETEETEEEEEEKEEEEEAKEEEEEEAKVETLKKVAELTRPVFYMRELTTSCAKLREEANTLFKSGQYGEACDKYTMVINVLEKEKDQVVNLSLMYSNRAACQLKIGDLPGCVRDCTTSLQLIPHSVKPLLRRATAYEHLERYRLAYIDNRHVLLLDNRVDQAHFGTKRCQEMLHQKDGPRWREKFQLPQVSQSEIPEIIGLDGKSTAPVVFNNPAASTPSQTTCSVNNQSQKGSCTAATHEPSNKISQANIVNNANKQPDKKEELSPQELFDDLKTKGNDHVKQGNFRGAIQCYSQCAGILPDQTVTYTNRALCYIRVNQPADAESDCTKALSLEKDNVKALFRRAQARKMLKRYREGIEDLKNLLDIDSKNAAAKKEMELLKNYWREELQSMKKEMKPETKAPPQGNDKGGKLPSQGNDKGGKSTSQGNDKGGKSRKRIVIEEADSEEEIEPAKAKPESKQNLKNKPAEKPETKPKIQEINKEPVSQKSESVPVKVKTETKDTKFSKPANKKSQIRETSSGFQQVPKTVPKLEKATPYEFISLWNSLKKSDTVKPYYELLKQISPSDIKTVISNKIDGQMLNVITRCVAEHYLPNGEEDESYQILKNLSMVPRFGTITLFMSEKDKSEVTSVMSRLESHSSTIYSAADIHKLRKAYSV